MKVGLDTSVLLRLLAGEPCSLAALAARRVEASLLAGDTVLVSDLVVSEAYFALQYHFGLSKAQAIGVLRDFLRQSGVVAAGAAPGILATPNLAVAQPGLVDRLIHAEYTRVGGEMLTFEKSAARLPGARVLRS
jgi:predicted nucleic-acid-binding protein